MLKRLSDQFFTFRPERLSGIWIEGIPTDAFAYGADAHMIRNDLADVVVLAISAAELFSGNDHTAHTEVAATYLAACCDAD